MEKSFLALVFLLPVFAFATELVDQGSACEEFTAQRELTLFKDPNLFRSELYKVLRDREQGWKKVESPVRARLKGRVSFMRIGNAQEFKNFGNLAKFYEVAEPRLRLSELSKGNSARIIPIQLCNDGALGFVLEADLENAATSEESEYRGMPPSGYPNEIPEYRYPSKDRRASNK